MGLLDDAIREHLELKRRRGADPDEVARQEDEALGDPRSGEFARPAAEPGAEAPAVSTSRPSPHARGRPGPASPRRTRTPSRPSRRRPSPLTRPSPSRARGRDARPSRTPGAGRVPRGRARRRRHGSRTTATTGRRRRPATAEFTPPGVEPEPDVVRPDDEPPGDEDVLEETPDFLQETPEHDRLWFEQKPPRDFDFDKWARPALAAQPLHAAGRLHVDAAAGQPAGGRARRRRRPGRDDARVRARDAAVGDVVRPGADRPGADYRNRIWMMRARSRSPAIRRSASPPRWRARAARMRVTYMQETRAGLQPIDVELDGGVHARARCSRSRLEFGPELDPAEVLGAVGLDARTTRIPSCRARSSSTGAVPRDRAVRDDPAALAALWPDYDRIAQPARAATRRPSACTSWRRPGGGHRRARARSLRAPRWARIRPPGRRPGRCAPTSPHAPARAR